MKVYGDIHKPIPCRLAKLNIDISPDSIQLNVSVVHNVLLINIAAE